MISFTTDYTRAACPEVMAAMANASEQYAGYSEDPLSDEARAMVRSLVADPEADVHLMIGGTQTNTTVIAAALRPHQGVIAADSGHINVHESGAIEATGHKVLALPGINGKLTATNIRECSLAHLHDPSREHMVQPAMVYISNPTEYGTIYSLNELAEISEVCHQQGLLLYLDGARLGYGLAAAGNNLTIPDIYRLTDAFYIGGTKVGAAFGEALVIRNQALRRDFRYILKQHGGLLAKGFLIGAQFRALLADDTYMRLSRHAITQADRIRETLAECGVPTFINSPTNQLFPVFEPGTLAALRREFIFDQWSASLIRITTDWGTPPEHVDRLTAAIRRTTGH